MSRFMRASEDEVILMRKVGAHSQRNGDRVGLSDNPDIMEKNLKIEEAIASNLRCAKHGIISVYAVIIGYPTEAFEEIDKTVDLALRMKGENPQANLIVISFAFWLHLENPYDKRYVLC